MQCEKVVIPSGVTLNIAANVSPPFSRYAERSLETTTVSGDYPILNCIQTSLETVQCTVKNSSNKKLTFCQPSYFGLAFENNLYFHASEINSHLSNLQEENAEPEFSDPDQASESIDDQIISEHQLFDLIWTKGLNTQIARKIPIRNLS
jgi:hypothetical protein